MSLYLSINNNDYILPDSAPVASILKQLAQLKTLKFSELGEKYVHVISEKAEVRLATHSRHYETMTQAEYDKRLKALRMAIPEKAGPDAHGRNITKREI